MPPIAASSTNDLSLDETLAADCMEDVVLLFGALPVACAEAALVATSSATPRQTGRIGTRELGECDIRCSLRCGCSEVGKRCAAAACAAHRSAPRRTTQYVYLSSSLLAWRASATRPATSAPAAARPSTARVGS